MGKYRRLISGLILFLITFFSQSTHLCGQEKTREEIFFQANQAYREGRYGDAIDGYNLLIRAGHENGHVYYNMGNAYFRDRKLGRAILYYERARLLIPRDADLNFNHRYALDKTVDAIPDSQGILTQTFFWLKDANFSELQWIFIAANIFFWGLLIIRFFTRSEWAYYLLIIVLVLWLISFLSFTLKWYQVNRDDRAVIIQEEVAVMAGPDERNTILFKLHEGAVVHHEREEDGWALIRLTDEKRGWVGSDTLERILPVYPEVEGRSLQSVHGSISISTGSGQASP